MNVLYTATAHATGDGRNGHARSDDGFIDLDLRIPTEMGGPGGATNPEELFAAGYAACFHSALKLVAGQRKLDVTGTEVSASIGIGPNDTGGFGLTAALVVYAPRPRSRHRGGSDRGRARGVSVLKRHSRQHRRRLSVIE